MRLGPEDYDVVPIDPHECRADVGRSCRWYQTRWIDCVSCVNCYRVVWLSTVAPWLRVAMSAGAVTWSAWAAIKRGLQCD